MYLYSSLLFWLWCAMRTPKIFWSEPLVEGGGGGSELQQQSNTMKTNVHQRGVQCVSAHHDIFQDRVWVGNKQLIQKHHGKPAL
eukprot:m.305334 g.305334  ORF g.305334 m.305334 type:complete len:84 (+) comp17718_c0_seq1:967-1218(+)